MFARGGAACVLGRLTMARESTPPAGYGHRTNWAAWPWSAARRLGPTASFVQRLSPVGAVTDGCAVNLSGVPSGQSWTSLSCLRPPVPP